MMQPFKHQLVNDALATISERSGESALVVAEIVAGHYGNGDFLIAEDVLYERLSKVVDELQSELGLPWRVSGPALGLTC